MNKSIVLNISHRNNHITDPVFSKKSLNKRKRVGGQQKKIRNFFYFKN